MLASMPETPGSPWSPCSAFDSRIHRFHQCRCFRDGPPGECRASFSKLVNNSCPELQALKAGPRLEGRVPLVVATLVVPLENRRPAIGRVFAAVTKEFSNNGVALALSQPRGLDEVALGFRWEGEMVWLRAAAKHLSPMGAGFFQLGFRAMEVSSPCRLSGAAIAEVLRKERGERS